MPPPSRILMTADSVGGVWVYATALARELAKSGYQINLVTLGPEPEESQVRDVQGVGGLDVTVTDLALEWMDPEGNDIRRSRRRLREIEQFFKPDVIHLNGYREALGAWEAPTLVVAHSCVRSWWQACRGEEPTEPRWFAYASNVQAGLQATDAWIAPTRAFRDCIQQLYSPPTSGRVIWNGLDQASAPTPKQSFILAAGRLWDEAKNVALLLEVAARAPRRTDWPIRIAGPITSGLQISRDVPGLDLLGQQPHDALIEQMRAAAVFVAPALYEPFGLTVLEAASAGCALVLSDIETFRELWDGAALFVNPRDPADLESALDALIRNDALRCTLQRKAARRAGRYSLSAKVGAYRDAYRALCSERMPEQSRRMLDEARP